MKTRTILFALALLFSGFVAQAQSPVKIGYADIDYLMSLLPEMKQVESELQDYQTMLGNQLNAKGQDFERKVQTFQQNAQSMTEEARNQQQADLQRQQQELEKFQSDSQISYRRKVEEVLSPLQEKVFNAINAVAEENGYSHIFAATANQAPILLYTKDEDPFMDLVMKKLGVTAPAGQMPTPGQGN
ncbi:OmpH family outer membrane protein [Penaeicola halotolerans]|uniref:OmpH family outer membrane protein n=1 Tax=Penaeicola halotolerans TaxID=2793196 RepID=UPI001CF88956|nr:OmpH family outer membrane protein [Penaeicola halotolerans]